MKADYRVGPAKGKEVMEIVKVQRRLGWCPFQGVQKILASISPEGILIGKIGPEVVSTVLATKFSGQFGFIGVYWVAAAERGHGLGIRIFNEALRFLQDCEQVGLDSVPDKTAVYERSGFKRVCSSHKHSCLGAPQVSRKHKPEGKVLTAGDPISLDEVAEFQLKAVPFLGVAHLGSMLGIGRPYVCVKNGQVCGYTVVTKLPGGFAVAPLIAWDTVTASDLLSAVFRDYQVGRNGRKADDRLYCFFTDECVHVAQLMRQWFPNHVYTCARMVRRNKDAEDFDRSSVFGISGYERG